MAQKTVVTTPDVAANSGQGTPLATAFEWINDNFDEVYAKPDLTLAANILTLTKPDGTTDTVDLSSYLDEDARAIASGTINGSGIVTFTRDDASTFTLDLSSLLDDTVANDATITLSAGSGLTGGGSFTTDQASADTVTFSTNDSEIVHDNLSGFVANEHIDHSTVSITAGSGLTGGGDLTATRDLAVNVDDSTIEVSSDIVQVKADGIDHSHLSSSYTALSPLGSGSSFAINFDSAATFTATANNNATLTMSNAQQGQTVDIIISGNFSITLAETGSTFNKVGTTNYDGTTTNIIQIICTDDSSGSKIYHYAVAPYTSSITV